MCKFFSFIADRKGNFYYSKVDSSHETIIKEFNLEDKELEVNKRSIVRLEYVSNDIFDFKSYVLNVDEKETPKWFNNTMYKEAKKFASKKIKDFVFIDTTALIVKNSFCYLRNSTAELYGNSKAELYGNSKARLYENSKAELHGNSKAELQGNSKAELYGNSTAELYENSKAELHGNSTYYSANESTLYISKEAKFKVQK